MTHSKLREQFAQRGRVKVIDRVPSGSPVDLVLRPAAGLEGLRTISATMALARRGMTMLKAKRAVEQVVERGEAIVHVPTVESIEALSSDLGSAGLGVAVIEQKPVDVQKVRQSLGMTQEQFAAAFGFEEATIRNWEQGRSKPDRGHASYITVIASTPDLVRKAFEKQIGDSHQLRARSMTSALTPPSAPGKPR